MFGVKYRKIFYAITAASVVLSVGAVLVFGVHPGIDFTGGSLLEVSYTGALPPKTDVESAVEQLNFGTYSIRESGEKSYVVRTRDLTEPEHQALKSALSQNGAIQLTEERFTSIGPTIGAELRNKALVAFLLVTVSILLFVAFAFRKVSKPVSSWVYGSIVVLTLLHDITIPTGVWAMLGLEADTLFLTAILVILGYSINDTVIIMDRIRERLGRNADKRTKEDFEVTVGTAVTDTYGRSLNTSFATLLSLLAIYFLGGESTQNFAFAMILGVATGTFSSIFFSAPLLVTVEQWQRQRKSKKS